MSENQILIFSRLYKGLVSLWGRNLPCELSFRISVPLLYRSLSDLETVVHVLSLFRLNLAL